MPVSTPWGTSQGSSRIAWGITFYSTASHGGIKLSPTKQAEMPPELRNKYPWYEEDDEVAKVIVGLPEYFSNDEYILAKDKLLNVFPKCFEAHFNITLQEGESKKKDKQFFLERNKENMLVVSTEYYNEDQNLLKCHAVLGGDRSHKEPPYAESYIVDADEYKDYMRNINFQFVIDKDKHLTEDEYIQKEENNNFSPR